MTAESVSPTTGEMWGAAAALLWTVNIQKLIEINIKKAGESWR